MGDTLIEVTGLHGNERGARDESPEFAPVLLVPGSSQQFHTNDIACRENRR